MNDLIAVKKLAEWDRLRTLVLDSAASPITRRVYNMALNEFHGLVRAGAAAWLQQGEVSASRASLETRAAWVRRRLIIRMSAIRKLAGEAELAAGISRVKSVKSIGVRIGNWLSLRQA